MTEPEMWEAVQRSDASYDGLFFYAVKTTGIFCRPSCKSKPPKRENLCYFASGEEARAAGFRPCKRCRSDLLEYQPMREIAAEIKARLDKASSLDDVGLTPRRMTDVFKQEYGVTPKEYADSLRLRTAKEMLAGSPEKVIDVAYQAGFSSLAAALMGLWYGARSFMEKDRNYILAKIGISISVVLVIVWAVIIITGIVR